MKFSTTKSDFQLIAAVAHRAVAMATATGFGYPYQDAMMDLDAVHSNGCPLDLAKLAGFDEFNFAHDVFGIRRHLDRATGKLGDCFVPRCAAKDL